MENEVCTFTPSLSNNSRALIDGVVSELFVPWTRLRTSASGRIAREGSCCWIFDTSADDHVWSEEEKKCDWGTKEGAR